MGSKNNPMNRGKKQIKTYKDLEVVPAMLIGNIAGKSDNDNNDDNTSGSTNGGRLIIAQYAKSRKMVTDANDKPILWDAL